MNNDAVATAVKPCFIFIAIGVRRHNGGAGEGGKRMTEGGFT